MQYRKGEDDLDACNDDATCGCHDSPVSIPDLSPCHDRSSLSHDIEGSCQSVPQGCQPIEPCPPRGCCPAQHSWDCGKPRRRVEVSPVQPVCPPVKIHRRPLQQYRPPLQSEDHGCIKPRRRVEQCPSEEPITLHPQPLQHRCPSIPYCHPPVQHCRPSVQHCRPPVQHCRPSVQHCHPPVQHCCPTAVPLPQHPGQHQCKQVQILPPFQHKK
ncbi:carboxypeptidase Y-like [Meleagris gallopavo]|uniref:carboxypeptidase Y-like n=1 Tax=Meleagris gallopavo TaxID=9103 RepID=UPI000549A3EF|nr:carboxypeptidase Y-like [Meleagris gallopavo]